MTQGHRYRYGSAFRSLSLAFALSLLFAIIPLGGAFAQTADEEPDGRFENTVELDATGAVDAAIAWSQFTFADGSSDTAALGRSDKFPDNLASSLIQGQEDAPLLLTGNEALDDAVAAELERLGVETVHILGGDAALDETVENELKAAGYTVHRDAGVTRIETAIDIARTHAPNATEGLLVRAFGGPSGDETQAWADALAGGAWAADENMPVFLTQTNELNDNLRAYLEDSDITSLTVLGGTAAISEAVVAELEAMGIDVNRVSGSNRFATAIAIAEARGFADPLDAGSVILIEGQAANAWASGFAAAAYADLSNGVIVLSNGANLPPETQAYLEGADANNDGVNDGSVTPNADGDPQLVCGPFVDAEACAAAAAALGYDEAVAVNQSFTDAPELIDAEMGSSDEDEDEQVVVFTFDEDVVEGAVSGGQFVLYQYDMTPIFGGDAEADGNQVEVVFDFEDAELATVAAVRQGAVQDDDGNENIEGSAPLQDVSLTANETMAPDLENVELDADANTATFVFDEDVDTENAGLNDFGIVVEDDGSDDATVISDYNLITDIDVEDNEVTVTFTTDFDEEDEVIRAFVGEDAVRDDDGNPNGPQSIDLDGAPEAEPRLLSTSLDLSDDTDDDDDPDTVIYRFSEAVDPVTANDNQFFVVLASGDTIFADATSIDDEDSEGTRIEVEFDDGVLDETVVRAGILDATVGEANTPARENEGIQTAEVNSVDFEAGQTIGPEVVGFSVEEDTNSFGDLDGYTVTFDFDEAIDDSTIEDDRVIAYESDGDESDDLVFTGDCDVDDDDESLLVCDIDDVDDAENVTAIALQYDAVRDFDGNPNYEDAFGFTPNLDEDAAA